MALKCDITLDDFARQLDQLLNGMTSPADVLFLASVRDFAPMGPDSQRGWQLELRRIREIITAMTPWERRDPDHLDIEQILRIALVSRTRPRDVTDFLRQFSELREKLADLLGRHIK
jgi:signal recognition particle GTPase